MNLNVMAHNLAAMNCNRMFDLGAAGKKKTVEKLSSGYKINRAADDAASLSISEKMRRLIRGLDQGTKNTQDGISWVQTGDGSLDEVHSILHRMEELTIKSLNGTLSDSDRSAIQVEFDQLQKEIDKVTDASVFNEKHIFADHDIPYYQMTGNRKWDQSQEHIVTDGYNDLQITYTTSGGGRSRLLSQCPRACIRPRSCWTRSIRPWKMRALEIFFPWNTQWMIPAI